MSEEFSTKVPTWFWVVSVLALLWNLVGVFAYIGQVMMSPEALQTLPADQRELIINTPAWATAAFAFAVWGGAIGSVLLFIKKKLSFQFFAVSFAGVLVQLYHSFFIAHAMEVYGPGGLVMPVIVLMFGAFMIWFSSFSINHGWLK